MLSRCPWPGWPGWPGMHSQCSRTRSTQHARRITGSGARRQAQLALSEWHPTATPNPCSLLRPAECHNGAKKVSPQTDLYRLGGHPALAQQCSDEQVSPAGGPDAATAVLQAAADTRKLALVRGYLRLEAQRFMELRCVNARGDAGRQRLGLQPRKATSAAEQLGHFSKSGFSQVCNTDAVLLCVSAACPISGAS
jgi:hypothetical protein